MAGNAHPVRTSGLHLFGGYDRGMVPKVLFAGFKVHFHWRRKDPPSPSSPLLSVCRFAGKQRGWAPMSFSAARPICFLVPVYKKLYLVFREGCFSYWRRPVTVVSKSDGCC